MPSAPDTRAAMKADMHGQLADATKLVWLLQNTLSGQREAESLAQMEEYAYMLRDKASAILGHVVRWSLMEEQ